MPTLSGKGSQATNEGLTDQANRATNGQANSEQQQLQTTAHGAERVAGPAATRGGVLSEADIAAVRQQGRVMTQSDGAIVRILQNEAGRFNIVVEGERGISAPANVICCFCGSQIPDGAVTTMVIYPPNAAGESQTLFCHGTCLVERLHARVPHHPSLEDSLSD